MYLLQLLSVALVAYRPASAIVHVGRNHVTITSDASVSCATGEARTKYESCSSEVASRLNECSHQDYGCACNLAASGFGCVTSYCPTHTEAVCSGSAVLNGLCSQFNQATPITFTDYSCPTSLVEDINSLIQSSLGSEFSSAADHVHSTIGPSGESGSSQNQQSQSTTSNDDSRRASNSILAPSETGAGRRLVVIRSVESGWGNTFLVGGVISAFMVAGLAAYL